MKLPFCQKRYKNSSLIKKTRSLFCKSFYCSLVPVAHCRAPARPCQPAGVCFGTRAPSLPSGKEFCLQSPPPHHRSPALCSRLKVSGKHDSEKSFISREGKKKEMIVVISSGEPECSTEEAAGRVSGRPPGWGTSGLWPE